MKYTKTLLNRTNDSEKVLSRGEIYEALNNEKKLEELAEIVVKNLSKIKGDVFIVKRNDEKVILLNRKPENNEEIEAAIEDSIVYKKIKESKKPYFEEKEGEFYAAFPLNFKGRMIGGLIIKEKQVIEAWEELYEFLNILVFSFKHYELVEKERENNIKDSITGLFNERYFRNHLEIEEEKYNRKQINHSLLMIKVENIEEISEEIGYEFEEIMLRKMAKTIKSQCRKADMPARIDRGMFGIILSHSVEAGAEVMMERIKSMLETEIEYRERKVNVKIKFAINQFKNKQTKETFYRETIEKLQ